MIPRIKKVEPLDNLFILVEFFDGKRVKYNLNLVIKEIPTYFPLKNKVFFKKLKLDKSRTCIYWNSEIDLPSDTIYEYGIVCEDEFSNFPSSELNLTVSFYSDSLSEQWYRTLKRDLKVKELNKNKKQSQKVKELKKNKKQSQKLKLSQVDPYKLYNFSLDDRQKEIYGD